MDFNAILKKQVVGSAPEPKPLPEGTYVAVIDGIAKVRTMNTKEGVRGIVSIPIGLQEPCDDVNEADLEAAGGLRTPSGEAKKVQAEFWNDKDSESGWSFGLDRFLAGFGISLDQGMTYADAFEAINGQECTVLLDIETYDRKDGTTGSKTAIKRVYAGKPT